MLPVASENSKNLRSPIASTPASQEGPVGDKRGEARNCSRIEITSLPVQVVVNGKEQFPGVTTTDNIMTTSGARTAESAARRDASGNNDGSMENKSRTRFFSAFIGGVALFVVVVAGVLLVLGADSRSGNDLSSASSRILDFEVIEIYPHDTNAFTQGLVYHEGYLYESTGLHGQSSVRKVDIETGEVLTIKSTNDAVPGDESFFGEGLCMIQDQLIQLTWQSRQAFIYDLDTLEFEEEFTFSTTHNEGWGIAYLPGAQPGDSEDLLVVSDGSSYLHFWNPQTFEEVGKVQVFDEELDQAIDNLNELEFHKGDLLANIWLTDEIVRINVATGHVIGYYDFSHENLPFEKSPGENVLNGIAYDSEKDVVYITGKRWRNMLQVRID